MKLELIIVIVGVLVASVSCGGPINDLVQCKAPAQCVANGISCGINSTSDTSMLSKKKQT